MCSQYIKFIGGLGSIYILEDLLKKLVKGLINIKTAFPVIMDLLTLFKEISLLTHFKGI